MAHNTTIRRARERPALMAVNRIRNHGGRR